MSSLKALYGRIHQHIQDGRYDCSVIEAINEQLKACKRILVELKENLERAQA